MVLLVVGGKLVVEGKEKVADHIDERDKSECNPWNA